MYFCNGITNVTRQITKSKYNGYNTHVYFACIILLNIAYIAMSLHLKRIN